MVAAADIRQNTFSRASSLRILRRVDWLRSSRIALLYENCGVQPT